MRAYRAVRLDITEAFEPVARLVTELVDAPGDPDADGLMRLIHNMRKLS